MYQHHPICMHTYIHTYIHTYSTHTTKYYTDTWHINNQKIYLNLPWNTVAHIDVGRIHTSSAVPIGIHFRCMGTQSYRPGVQLELQIHYNIYVVHLIILYTLNLLLIWYVCMYEYMYLCMYVCTMYTLLKVGPLGYQFDQD